MIDDQRRHPQHGGVVAVKSFPYLYGVEGNPNASFPVMEHLAPAHRRYRPDQQHLQQQQQHEQHDENEEDRPDFLFRDTGTYRIVEFYVHWCDVCKNFKPHYIELGRRIQQQLLLTAGINGRGNTTTTLSINTTMHTTNTTTTTVVVHVHAVSCAPNRPLCKALAISKYPLFRVYTPGDTTGVDIPHAQVNPHFILQRMGLVAHYHDDHDDEEILVDDTGRDWHVDDDSVAAADAASNTASSSSSWFNWGAFLLWEQWWTKNHHPQQQQQQLGKFDKNNYKRSRHELRNDVHLSFDYAMRQGVYITNDPLPQERAETLFAWLVLLRKTLPVSWTKLHAAVQGLIDNFDYVQRSEDYMVAILDEHAPSAAMLWSPACAKHGDVDAGYACGLWQLFHAVTVGAVDGNRAAAFAAHRVQPATVARTLRDFVDAFFGCDACRRNFVAAFDAGAHRRRERLREELSPSSPLLSANAKHGHGTTTAITTTTEADWIELPLWLFDTHNAVNVRLQAEKAAREHRPAPTARDQKAVLWPPVSDCPPCWQNDDYDDNNKNNTWNNDAVYKYLKLEYGQRDALSAEYKRELFPPPPAVVAAVFAPAAVGETPHPLPRLWWNGWWTHMINTWIPAMFVPFDSNPQQPSRRTLEDLRADVHLSFDWAMRHEVSLMLAIAPLTDRVRTALRDWLTVLSKTLPPSWTTMHSLVKELLDNFAYVAKNANYLTAVLDEFPPDRAEWTLACSQQHGKVGAGYTCGLWETFHVVTIGVIRHNTLVASSDKERLATAKVARTIRTYVDHFFLSEFGRPEFLASFDSCEHDRCDKLMESPGAEADWVHLPLWMFLFHNDVSVRLAKERATLENRELAPQEEIAAQWPSRTECPRCRLKHGKWDASMIYKYLLLEYGPQDVLTIGLREELLETPESGVESTRGDTVQSDGEKLYHKQTHEELKAAVRFAFDSMMRNGIYTENAPLPEKRRAVLKAWLVLLDKTLPAPWSSMRSLVTDLLHNFSYVVKTKDYLVAVLEEYRPDPKEILAVCPIVDADADFACGAWDMLHVVTVGAVKFNRGASDTQRLATDSVARTIKDTVGNFLSWDICERTLADFFDGCEQGRCGRLTLQSGREMDWIQLPLWLAAMHNEVNRRSIMGVASRENRAFSSQEELDAFWPAKRACDSCWFENNRPNEEVTYLYLERKYAPQGTTASEVHQEL